MKSEMPFHGVRVPEVRRLTRAILPRHPLPDAEAWQRAVLLLWRKASYREERYAAIEIVLASPHRKWLAPERLPMIDELIVDGAWWDYVDAIAINGLGAMLRAHPRQTEPALRRWAGDENHWRRRAAILSQLKFKERTDLALLHACIEPSIDAKEFFLGKAIGWALREYSKTNPEFVTDYVRDHDRRLSGLAKREALKALKRKADRAGSPSRRVAAAKTDSPDSATKAVASRRRLSPQPKPPYHPVGLLG